MKIHFFMKIRINPQADRTAASDGQCSLDGFLHDITEGTRSNLLTLARHRNCFDG